MRLYRAFRDFVRCCGPIKIHPVKSRIAFMVRMRFAGVSRIGKGFIEAGFISHRKIESPRLTKYEFIPPNCQLHNLKITSTHDLADEFLQWIMEAYSLGTQDKLLRR